MPNAAPDDTGRRPPPTPEEARLEAESWAAAFSSAGSDTENPPPEPDVLTLAMAEALAAGDTAAADDLAALARTPAAR